MLSTGGIRDFPSAAELTSALLSSAIKSVSKLQSKNCHDQHSRLKINISLGREVHQCRSIEVLLNRNIDRGCLPQLLLGRLLSIGWVIGLRLSEVLLKIYVALLMSFMKSCLVIFPYFFRKSLTSFQLTPLYTNI